MERIELEELRERVPCAAVLENAGFAIDLRQSTRRAVKYRRGDAIVIVIHGGRGWFDPLSEAKGDVFSLVEHLDGVPFVEGLGRVASLVGYTPKDPVWPRSPRASGQIVSVAERWSRRPKPWPGSMAWRYLRDERCVPGDIIRAAVRDGSLREGPQGSIWAAHRDEAGMITGWEERGREWRGFSTGGSKLLFRFGPADAPRLCVTEAAIDAISLASLERARPDSLYLSTGGGWSLATDTAIRALATAAGALLVAATDNNCQGESYADRLKAMAVAIGCGFERLRPTQVDWNAELQAGTAKKQEEPQGRQEELGCRTPAGGLKGSFARVPRPLTRPDFDAAAGRGQKG